MLIIGIRLLINIHGPGKVASSLVNYMKSAEEIGKLKIGKKLFCTNWDRGRKDKSKGPMRVEPPTPSGTSLVCRAVWDMHWRGYGVFPVWEWASMDYLPRSCVCRRVHISPEHL